MGGEMDSDEIYECVSLPLGIVGNYVYGEIGKLLHRQVEDKRHYWYMILMTPCSVRLGNRDRTPCHLWRTD